MSQNVPLGLQKEYKYQSCLQRAKTEAEPGVLVALAESFDALGDFRDSPALAEHCRRRADEERAKRAAEAKERAAREKKRIAIVLIAAAAVIALGLLGKNVIIPRSITVRRRNCRKTGSMRKLPPHLRHWGITRTAPTEFWKRIMLPRMHCLRKAMRHGRRWFLVNSAIIRMPGSAVWNTGTLQRFGILSAQDLNIL